MSTWQKNAARNRPVMLLFALLLCGGAGNAQSGPGPNDEPLLVRVLGYRKAGQGITVAVAEDLAPIAGRIVRWQIGFGVATVGALLGLLAVQAWLLRRSFAPLKRVQDEVCDLERGERGSLSESVPSQCEKSSKIRRLRGRRRWPRVRGRRCVRSSW